MEAVNINTKIMIMTGSNFKSVGDVENDPIEVGGTADTKAESEVWSSAAVHSTRQNLLIIYYLLITHTTKGLS